MSPEPEAEARPPPAYPPPSPYPPMPPMHHVQPVSPQRTIQVGVAVLSLVLLAVAVAVVFMALMDVVHIWFEYQWVPVARAVLAGLVALLSLYVLRLLVKGRLTRA